MKPFVGIGISIGLLAGLWTFVSAELGLLTWVGFVSWALFFAAGGGFLGFRNTLAANLSGVFWAWAVSQVIAVVTGNVALAVAVGVIALLMCLQAAFSVLSFIPGAFLGAAVFFGTSFDLVGSVLALVIGVSLGWASGILGARIQSAVDSAPTAGAAAAA